MRGLATFTSNYESPLEELAQDRQDWITSEPPTIEIVAAPLQDLVLS
jgi:hypothetical protein